MCYILIATYTIWLATVTWFWANRCVKPLNRKTIVAKFFTHVSAHLINGFIKYYSREFLCLMHSTCTWKPTECHQTLPSPCMILKAICTGVGCVWLARLSHNPHPLQWRFGHAATTELSPWQNVAVTNQSCPFHGFTHCHGVVNRSQMPAS